MSEGLFMSIISQLKYRDFNGRLSFYLNGEPLLDKRLSKWVSIGKKSCPRSFTFIISNGDLLTCERIIQLIDSGLDAMKVNTYDDRTFLKVSEEIQKLPASLSRNVLHLDYSKKRDWTSRGGTVPVVSKKDVIVLQKTVCLRPFRQIYITSHGLVAQCCSDALNRYIMGDVNKQSLLEIWNGEPFMRVRNSLLGKGELNELCRVCDLERVYETVDDLRKLFDNR
jgi:radical SAM protein with 4Fe4S-binding SPASM domain